MNTRAIIAKEIGHGYFTSWCWIDKEPATIGNILRKYFSSEEEVDEILKYRNILGIFDDYRNDITPSMPGKYSRLSNGFYIKYDDGKSVVVSGGLNGFFRTIHDMLNEDIRSLYIFSPKTKEWLFYRNKQNTPSDQLDQAGMNANS